MGILLSDLIENVGTAVLNANAAIEQTAVAAYLGQGYERVSNDGGEEYIPVSYTISVPSVAGNKKLNVPVTALMNHSSMRLEQVDVKLRFVVEEDEGKDVAISVGTPKDLKDNYSMSELALQFKSAIPSEGIARVNNRHIQTL